jgi:hypothetical protein
MTTPDTPASPLEAERVEAMERESARWCETYNFPKDDAKPYGIVRLSNKGGRIDLWDIGIGYEHHGSFASASERNKVFHKLRLLAALRTALETEK